MTESRREPVAQAVALRYEQHRGAPEVIAKGQGLIADEIIRRARAEGLPVHESRELVSLLMKVDLDTQIPPALYTAVAEILAWIWREDARRAGLNPNGLQASQINSNEP